jgi:tRNA pseudouridine13 synthase
MPGHSLFAASGLALRREEEVLAEAEIDPRSFAAGGDEMQGARRPYRIAIEDLSVSGTPDALSLVFSLPKGSYAAAVLREVMKSGAPDEPEE